MDREQQLNDALAVVKILVSREQSALAWSVAQLASEAASRYWSFGKYSAYQQKIFAPFHQESK